MPNHPDDSPSSSLALEAQAREEIRQVMCRYCTGVDRKDFDLVRSAYHDDAYDDHGSYKGDVDGLIEMLHARHERITQSLHFLGNSTIELKDDRAFGQTYAIVYQRVDGKGDRPAKRTNMGVRYLDRFERRDRRWAIVEHVVAWEWWREEPCEDERPFGADWTVSQRSREDVMYRMRAAVFG